LDLEPRDQQPPLARVRQWVAAALVGLADESVDAVLQVATELITNAFVHGGGSQQLRLERHLGPCWVRIEVDDVATNESVVDSSRLGVPRGYGLLLVDKFAADWGVSAWTQGKTMWARIDC
jgi:anti-sigma regulatory factor (Ser/Thr protein kinase)